MKTFFVRTTFFAVEVHGKEDEFKRLHRCRLGQLLKSRKMKAPPNKLAYREDGNCACQTGKCGIAFGQQQANEETAN